MATVNGERGFTQLTLTNILDRFFIRGNEITSRGSLFGNEFQYWESLGQSSSNVTYSSSRSIKLNVNTDELDQGVYLIAVSYRFGAGANGQLLEPYGSWLLSAGAAATGFVDIVESD